MPIQVKISKSKNPKKNHGLVYVLKYLSRFYILSIKVYKTMCHMKLGSSHLNDAYRPLFEIRSFLLYLNVSVPSQ